MRTRDQAFHMILLAQEIDIVLHSQLAGQPLPFPTFPNHVTWVEALTTEGIFSTLSRMGTSTDPTDEGAADIGAQYRVTIGDDSKLNVLSTDWRT